MIAIALGANLPSRAGGPRETLLSALACMPDVGIDISAVSRFYESVAWPDPSDPVYVNAIAAVKTRLDPTGLLEALHGIERMFGRERGARNAPRTLDLDIVDYDGRVEKGPPVLPHPRMQDRAFVLIPLRDVAPGWRHPVSGLTLEQLIAALPQTARGIRPLRS